MLVPSRKKSPMERNISLWSLKSLILDEKDDDDEASNLEKIFDYIYRNS